MFSDKDKKMLQMIAVFAVVAVAGLFFYQRSTRAQAGAIDAKIATFTELQKSKSKELEELRLIMDRSAEIGQMMTAIEEKRKRLPQTAEAREFYNIIRECIQITNLSELRIAPVAPVPMGLYEEVPYYITCRARFHELGQFLMLVEQHGKQIMRIKTLDIGNDLKRPSRHPVLVRLATFVFLPTADKEVAQK
jgi:Tfp pilus assembly protein PilO